MFLSFPTKVASHVFFLGKAHVLHLNLVLFQHLKFVIRHPECPKKKYEERDECEKILGGK